jgi:hypothetical protein
VKPLRARPAAVDTHDVRRLFVTVAALVVFAVPAGAQPASSWVRHQGDGISVELPASWATEKNRTRLIREVRRVATDDPELASIIDNLLAASESNVAVKLIAFDLAESSLKTGFATNLNIVRERTSLPLALWRQDALKQLNATTFVMQPIWWRNVELPAGKAVRLAYKARFNVGGKRLDASITQYALMGKGAAIVLTYTTLPRLASSYRATFLRSAKSFRFR